MACPKFDINNKKHVLILVFTIVAIVLVAVIITVVVLVTIAKKDGDNVSSDNDNEGGSAVSRVKDSEDGGGGAISKPSAGGGGEGGGDYRTIGLNVHNDLRRNHHADPLKLSDTLNDLAHDCAKHYAKKGTIDHSCPHKSTGDGQKAGENLYMQGSTNVPTEAEVAEKGTRSWYDEIKLYDFSKGAFSMQTGHFTQLVWKASTELGLGIHMKKDGKFTNVFFVALYSPHGNIQGKFKENVMK